ncbi:alpha/beta hydrolase fold-domain-containing protein [Crepidotus variabilis]|uniref:Alpha/beta hydrolase fold-domain-containing protein n=1 Tax=Crepidotus variabilis TaxID=179855 RepID=A0A9P6ELY7_9AGAR|nr:alpha/beta hydrolase fold-domain-containing protein [Crepidotus variabilis]
MRKKWRRMKNHLFHRHRPVLLTSSIMAENTATQPKQPIHLNMIPKLDPEYVAFHNEHLINLTPPHTLPWDPAIRNGVAVPGASEPLKVAKTQDFDLPHTKFRAFTPEGQAPSGGWPLFIFFHGGGWTLGNIGSETTFTTNMAVRANCVAISVDYRLAPEHPYPAAVDDAVDSLRWVIENGPKELGIDLTKVAIGGSSSGGNLATIAALKAVELKLPIQLVLQLLIVPVTDNTSSINNSWKENQLTPWLSPERMLWFRHNYLPNEADWTKWDASPIFAPSDLVAKLPRTWIAVAERDILNNEGISYGQKLKDVGVSVEIEIYRGAPHPIMAMDGALAIGRKMITDAVTTLKSVF